MILAWLDYWTVLLVLFVALLLFGGRLPEVARSLGRSLNEFKRGLNEVKDEIERTDNSVQNQPKLRPPSEPRLENPKPEPPAKSELTAAPRESEVPSEDSAQSK